MEVEGVCAKIAGVCAKIAGVCCGPRKWSTDRHDGPFSLYGYQIFILTRQYIMTVPLPADELMIDTSPDDMVSSGGLAPDTFVVEPAGKV